MKINFTFNSQGDYDLAIAALDNLHLEQRTDSRNVNLSEDQRQMAAQKSAQAFRVAREIENLARRIS